MKSKNKTTNKIMKKYLHTYKQIKKENCGGLYSYRIGLKSLILQAQPTELRCYYTYHTFELKPMFIHIFNDTKTVPFNVRTGSIASDISFPLISPLQPQTKVYVYIASDCLTPGEFHRINISNDYFDFCLRCDIILLFSINLAIVHLTLFFT